ncbi:MAG: AAA family ATPase [Gemmataceae bacterium]
MYVSHFGLRHRPFRSSPDPTCYYPAGPQEEALETLQRALADGDGFAIVTGEPGVGKTLLATILLDRHSDDCVCVFVTNSHLTRRADLLQAILFDLGRPYEGKSEQELRLAVTETVLASFAEEKQTLLVIDEAHHLPADLLEELRLLGNLETRHGKAVQIVLVAQPEILDTLKRPELRALSQRITARAEIGRLGLTDAADYLVHHLRLAGARPDSILPDEPLAMLAKASGGIPRLLNQSAHLSLSVACQAGNGRVDAEAVLESLQRLGLDLPAEEAEEPTAEPTEVPEPQGWRQGMYPLPPVPPRLVFAPGKSG